MLCVWKQTAFTSYTRSISLCARDEEKPWCECWNITVWSRASFFFFKNQVKPCFNQSRALPPTINIKRGNARRALNAALLSPRARERALSPTLFFDCCCNIVKSLFDNCERRQWKCKNQIPRRDRIYESRSGALRLNFKEVLLSLIARTDYLVGMLESGHSFARPLVAGVCGSTPRVLMKRVKTICLSTSCWSPVINQKSVQSSSSPY